LLAREGNSLKKVAMPIMMNHTLLQKQGFRARAQDVLLNGKPPKENTPKPSPVPS